MTAPELVEQRLTRALSAWSAGSVLIGSALLRGDHRAFGRQTLLWGAVDGAIAGVGAVRRRRGHVTDPARLRRVLLLNAGLDTGYLGIGALLLRRARWRGDGAAVLVQGAFLLGLDTVAARALERPGG